MAQTYVIDISILRDCIETAKTDRTAALDKFVSAQDMIILAMLIDNEQISGLFDEALDDEDGNGLDKFFY